MTSSSASKSSFFASFTPRWGRSQSYQNTAASGLTPADKSVKERHAKEQEQNKEKIKLWIKEQAQKLYDAYFSDNAVGKSHPALNVLHKLTEASEKLNIENDCGTEPLKEICDVLSEPSESGASPFEIVHSGMVKQLLKYLTDESSGKGITPQSTRIKRFLSIFLGCSATDYISTSSIVSITCWKT
jgi:E3 ubiquitin-protein ligase TRIP12